MVEYVMSRPLQLLEAVPVPNWLLIPAAPSSSSTTRRPTAARVGSALHGSC